MKLFVTILIIFIGICSCNLVILSPLSLSKTYSAFSARLNDFSWNNLTAELVAIDTDGCEVLKENVTGKIVMYNRLKNGIIRCSYRRRLLLIQEANAAGAVMMGDGVGGSAYVTLTEKEKRTSIPAVSLADNNELWELASNPDVSVIASISPDLNSFQTFFKGEAPMLVFSLFLGFYAFGCFCLASWKFSGFLLFRGKEMGLPGIILALEMCAAVIRVVHLVDPVWSRGIYDYAAISILITLSNPFSFASTLLITFYWQEAISKLNVLKIPTLNRFKKPAIVLIIIIFVLVLSDSISRAVYAGIPFLTTLSPGLFAILTLAIALFYIIVGSRLLRTLTISKAQNIKGTKRRRNLKRVSTLLVVCAISLIIMLISFIFFSAVVSSAGAQYINWWFIFGSQYTVSLCLILVFERPQPNSTSDSFSSEPSKKKTSDVIEIDVSIETNQKQ